MLTLTALMILFCVLCLTKQLSCQGPGDDPINNKKAWWAVFKPKGSRKELTKTHYYFEEKFESFQEKDKRFLDEGTALYNTLIQLKNNPDVSYLAFNDQYSNLDRMLKPEKNKKNAPWAHAKGVIFWEKTQGIFLHHTLPYFPHFFRDKLHFEVGTNQKPKLYEDMSEGKPNYERNAQQIVCFNIQDENTLEYLLDLLSFSHVFEYSRYDPNEVLKLQLKDLRREGYTTEYLGGQVQILYNMAKQPAVEVKSLQQALEIKPTKIKNNGGNFLTVYSKSPNHHIQIMEAMSRQFFNDQVLLARTWNNYICHNKWVKPISVVQFPDIGKNQQEEGTRCPKSQKILDPKTISNGSDHSKWLVSEESDPGHRACFCDLNREHPQTLRGGSCYCFESLNLWKALLRVVRMTGMGYNQKKTDKKRKESEQDPDERPAKRMRGRKTNNDDEDDE